MMTAARTHYETLLESGATAEAMHDAIHALSVADLVSYGLNAYRMNLVSLFGAHWPRERIEMAARDAAVSKLWLGWDYYQSFLHHQDETVTPPQLEGGLIDRVRSLLAQGRGVLVASFHQGHMRHIPSDIANAGIEVHVPLAADSWNDYRVAQSANPTARMWTCFRYINVEVAGGALAIARLLRGNGVVFSTIDGNTGMDGPRGKERRTRVGMHGRHAMVKNGLLAMAARFGTPILPVIARTDGARRVCRFGTVLDPGGPLAEVAAGDFVSNAAQELYSMLAAELETHAGEWCGGDLFHQWRVPEAHGALDSASVERVVQRVLDGHARVMVNPARATALGEHDDVMLIDALSMRGYKVPMRAACFFDEQTPQLAMATSTAHDAASSEDVTWLRTMVGRELLTLSQQI